MLQQREETGAQHRLGRVVPGGDELHEEAAEVELAHRLSAEVAFEDEGCQVGGRLDAVRHGRAAFRGEVDRVHRHLDRGAVVGRFAGSDEIGILARRLPLGEIVQVRPVGLGKAHQAAHHPGRQARGDVVHELDVTAFRRLGHEVATDGADLRLELADDARLEAVGDGLAVCLMAGRIHRQQHAAHHLEAVGVESLEHHAALGRREQVGFPGDVHHVVVAEHGPEARLAVAHLLPGDTFAGAQLGEFVVGDAVDEGVGVAETEGHAGVLMKRRG